MTALTPQSHTVTTTDNYHLIAFSYGDSTLPPLVMVHGYPDHHAVWEKIIPFLMSKFYVIAYDVRGAGQSDCPSLVTAYTLPQLSEDLQAVTTQLLGERPYHLVAHDWGSIQSWEAVTDPNFTGKILSFSTMSGPCLDHVALYLRSIKHQPIKLLKILSKSWYISLLHLPVVAPAIWQTVTPKKWQQHRQKLEKTADIPLDTLVQTDGKQGVELYRANFLPRNFQPRQRYAHCPVQAIEFTDDKFVSSAYIDVMPRWVKNFTRVSVTANHWGILSQPEAVAQHISDFARRYHSV